MKDRLSIQQLAREKSPKAIEVLADLLDTAEKESDRIRCAEILLNRGFGTPASTIQIQAQLEQQAPGDPQAMSHDDLRAEVMRRLEAIAPAPLLPSPDDPDPEVKAPPVVLKSPRL